MKKQQFNTVQKVVYIILTVLAVLTILNFFSFGFLFAWAFGFIGTGLQVVVCFASLLFGSWAWAENEIADKKYTF